MVLGRLQTSAFDGTFENLFCSVHFYIYFLTLEKKQWFFFKWEIVETNRFNVCIVNKLHVFYEVFSNINWGVEVTWGIFFVKGLIKNGNKQKRTLWKPLLYGLMRAEAQRNKRMKKEVWAAQQLNAWPGEWMNNCYYTGYTEAGVL